MAKFQRPAAPASRDLLGKVYPYDDEAAFAAAVRRLLASPEEAAALGAAAREAAEAYRLDRVLPQVMALYLSAGKP